MVGNNDKPFSNSILKYLNYKGVLISFLLVVLSYYQLIYINGIQNAPKYYIFLIVLLVIGSVFDVLSFISNKEYLNKPKTINMFIRYIEFTSALFFLFSSAYSICSIL